jgi:hypothetical protein
MVETIALSAGLGVEVTGVEDVLDDGWVGLCLRRPMDIGPREPIAKKSMRVLNLWS